MAKQRGTSRDAFRKPPSNATEYGGHEGMAEDWVPYGHAMTAAELASYQRRLPVDQAVSSEGELLPTRDDPIEPSA